MASILEIFESDLQTLDSKLKLKLWLMPILHINFELIIDVVLSSLTLFHFLIRHLLSSSNAGPKCTGNKQRADVTE